jgi:hypothetical protein
MPVHKKLLVVSTVSIILGTDGSVTPNDTVYFVAIAAVGLNIPVRIPLTVEKDLIWKLSSVASVFIVAVAADIVPPVKSPIKAILLIQRKQIPVRIVEMSFTRSAGTPPPWYGVNPIQTGISSNYSALATDYYIGVNGTNVTITLPVGTSVVQGKTYIIKDESGLISTNGLYQVTVTRSGSNLIDGQTSFIIALNYGAVNVMWTGSFWSIF